MGRDCPNSSAADLVNQGTLRDFIASKWVAQLNVAASLGWHGRGGKRDS